jgi:hypothetical protein
MSIKYLIGKKAEIVEYRDCNNIDCLDCDEYDACDNERWEERRYKGTIVDAHIMAHAMEESCLVI